MIACPTCQTGNAVDAQFCGSCGNQLVDHVAGSSEELRTNYPVGLRIIAGLIDIAILWVLFLVMAAAIGTFGETDSRRFDIRLNGEEFLLYIALCFGYFILLEALAAATVGKMVMRLQVAKVNGQPYGLGAVLARNLLRVVDGFLYPFYIVGIIAIAVSEKKQRIGDLAAGTLVVKRS